MRRRWLDGLGLALACLVATAVHAGTPPSLLVLGFELIDEQADVTPFPEAEARLAAATERIAQGLAAAGLYRVVDPAPIAADIRAANASNYSLLDCKGCELELARKLGTERVLLGWVQRVSNLILNLNIEVRDVASGRTLFNKSADMRGNNDRSWQRAADFVVRDMVARGQGGR